MTARRKGKRTRNLPTLHLYEEELLHRVESDRRLALVSVLLIFLMSFCALVFYAYFKEMLAYDKCDLRGGTGCSSIASSSGASP